MAKIRVYELAKNLNLTNKVLLAKMKDMNIEVGSHMSSLDDDTVQRIRTKLFGKKKVDAADEKRVKSTVIRRRKKVVAEPEPEAVEAAKTEEPVAEAKPAPEAQKPAEEEPAEKVVEAPAEKAPEAAEEPAPVEAAPPAPEKPVEEEVSAPAKPAPKKKAPDKKQASAARIISTPVTPAPPEPEEEKPSGEPETAQAEKTAKTEDAEVKPPAAPEPAPEEKKEPEPREAEAAPEAKTEPTPPTPSEEKEEKTLPGKATATKEVKPQPQTQVKPKKKAKKSTAAKIIKLPDQPITPAEIRERQPGGSQPAARRPQRRPAPGGGAPRPSDGPPRVMEAAPGETDQRGRKKGAAKQEKRKGGFKRKSVVEGKALYGGGRGRKGKKGGRYKAPSDGLKTQITVPKAIKRRVKIDDTIALSELAKRMGIKANEMIAKLMGLGVMATVNQTIDFDTAALVAGEFDYEVERAAFEEELLMQETSEPDAPESMVTRPPVVTIMGHVDHGKTSLLDVIRKSSIVDVEAGGITQHIGAYYVDTTNGKIAFIDTPGHEAFTAMRSRGATVTDIVILVVAADDGVMPQTVEAINHAKASGVPIVVAVNKMDKEDADPERVKRELSEHGILSEDWGGENIFVNVSAKKEMGIDELLEMVLLQAEVLDLKANPDKLARGHVIEARLDSGRGPVATILVQDGTLKVGQSVVCGIHYGRIRAMVDDLGSTITDAGPSIPAEVIGLAGVPEAGDELIVIADEKNAKQVSAHRIQKQRAKELAKSSRVSLEGLFEQLSVGEVKDLNLIIKADVHGSIEALKDSLSKIENAEVKINVRHAATGTVSESDISLAAVSNAIIIGFNVRPGAKVHELAKEENVDMRFYDIIYNAIKEIKDAMVGMMESTFEERVLGRAEVRDTFVIPKKGTIAGTFVNDGKIERGQRIRLLRDGVIKVDGHIASLRRFKDDVKEVTHGYECGIGIEKYNDIKVGDTIECYYLEEIKPSLD